MLSCGEIKCEERKGSQKKKKNPPKKTENQQSNTKERQSVTGTQLLAEPSSGQHRIQLSFELFPNDTVIINLYTSGAKEFWVNPHYALVL